MSESFRTMTIVRTVRNSDFVGLFPPGRTATPLIIVSILAILKLCEVILRPVIFSFPMFVRKSLARTSFSVNDVSASTPVFFKFQADDVTRDDKVRDLLDAGDTSVNPSMRQSAYKHALTRIAEQAYIVPLYSLPVFYAHSKELDFRPHADESPRFWEARWK